MHTLHNCSNVTVRTSVLVLIVILCSESSQPVKQKKRSRAGFGKKINTVKIKAGGMQSGLVRLYMVDIPHFGKCIKLHSIIMVQKFDKENL